MSTEPREIICIYNHCNDSGILGEIVRVGMRYIDFFQDNIFEHCVLSLHFQDKNLADQSTALHTKVEHDDEYISDLRMSNMANLKRDGENKIGSIIDIDTYVDDPELMADNPLITLLERQHEIIKELFFSLLKPEFLETFNPEYE